MEFKREAVESDEAGCSRSSREMVVHEGHWGYGSLEYCVDGTKPNGSHFVCWRCKEACVNPVIIGCNHVSCRECLDQAGGYCPGCQLAFSDYERVYLNRSLGAQFWEFKQLLGKYGRGGGTKYAVKWLSGEITREPARNVPAEARKQFLKARKIAKKLRKNKKLTYKIEVSDLVLNFKKEF